jgi:hypothetical protein
LVNCGWLQSPFRLSQQIRIVSPTPAQLQRIQLQLPQLTELSIHALQKVDLSTGRFQTQTLWLPLKTLRVHLVQSVQAALQGFVFNGSSLTELDLIVSAYRLCGPATTFPALPNLRKLRVHDVQMSLPWTQTGSGDPNPQSQHALFQRDLDVSRLLARSPCVEELDLFSIPVDMLMLLQASQLKSLKLAPRHGWHLPHAHASYFHGVLDDVSELRGLTSLRLLETIKLVGMPNVNFNAKLAMLFGDLAVHSELLPKLREFLVHFDLRCGMKRSSTIANTDPTIVEAHRQDHQLGFSAAQFDVVRQCRTNVAFGVYWCPICAVGSLSQMQLSRVICTYQGNPLKILGSHSMVPQRWKDTLLL